MSYTNKENCLDLFDPFVDVFFKTRNAAANNSFGSLAMKTDIIEKDGEYTLYVDMPGVKKENINITYEDGYLTIEANADNKLDEKEKYISRERFSGTASRTYYLDQVDEDTMNASFEDGVLRINFKELKPEVKTKKIQIN